MMAITDIFEALTASDRPDKNGKTLREAITIMDGMRRDGDIDADLFDLFLRLYSQTVWRSISMAALRQ
jgi:HD-GYP domain-containing protein (c-di-GMP phosphodiesterase class II)